jgi:hypothetical protein
MNKDDDDNVVKFVKRKMADIRKQAKPKAKPLHGEGNPKQKGPRGKYKSTRDQGLTDKQEGVAREIAAGTHFIEAVRKHYDCENMQDGTVAKFASVTKNKPKVKERVEQLKRQVQRALDAQLMGLPAPTSHMPAIMAKAVEKQSEIVGDVVVTRQFIIREQLKNMQLARETAQTSAAVAAMNAIAKISGFDSDNREKQATGELERMSPDELKAYIAEELSKVGLVSTDLGLGELVNMKTIDKLPN